MNVWSSCTPRLETHSSTMRPTDSLGVMMVASTRSSSKRARAVRFSGSGKPAGEQISVTTPSATRRNGTVGAVAITDAPYSSRSRWWNTSACSNPRNPALKPGPSAVLEFGLSVTEESLMTSLSTAALSACIDVRTEAAARASWPNAPRSLLRLRETSPERSSASPP